MTGPLTEEQPGPCPVCRSARTMWAIESGDTFIICDDCGHNADSLEFWNARLSLVGETKKEGGQMDRRLTVAKAPCKSCPYRRDVPSGVWAAEEYDKLPGYDGDIIEQLVGGGEKLFDCHQQDGHLCAGWLGTHGAVNLLAMRIHAGRSPSDPEVWDYVSPVPVFSSGQEACDHGKADIERPSEMAERVIERLIRKRGRVKREHVP